MNDIASEAMRVHEWHVAATTHPDYLAHVVELNRLKAEIRRLSDGSQCHGFIDRATIAALQLELSRCRGLIDIHLRNFTVSAAVTP